MQAYWTMRKGNKKFAVFDLSVTLAWEGRWLAGDVKVSLTPVIVKREGV